MLHAIVSTASTTLLAITHISMSHNVRVLGVGLLEELLMFFVNLSSQ